MRGTDLAEGKLSWPVVWTLDHAPAGLAADLLAIVRCPREETSAADVARGLALLEQAGALAATARWLARMREETLAHPFAAAAPGLVNRFLAPVEHAL
jgi:geranylgeranyl pyrophosphate synthase